MNRPGEGRDNIGTRQGVQEDGSDSVHYWYTKAGILTAKSYSVGTLKTACRCNVQLNRIAFTGCIFLTRIVGIINTRKQIASVPKQTAATCHQIILTAAWLR